MERTPIPNLPQNRNLRSFAMKSTVVSTFVEVVEVHLGKKHTVRDENVDAFDL